ncbi:MAG: hypothetical protein U0905_02625 [Pirellulales bacterium]
MPKKNPLIDNYLKDGCGRCPLGGTPECKVNPWRPILTKLRKALLDCGLTGRTQMEGAMLHLRLQEYCHSQRLQRVLFD